MNKQLELLIGLSREDKAMTNHEERMRRIPLEIEKLHSSCVQAQQEAQKLKDAIENENKKRKELEKEVEQEKDHLTKIKKKLTDIKNNREYTALLAEIETTKKNITEIEDRELVLMESIEEEKRALPEKEKVFKDQEKEFEELKKERGIELERLTVEFSKKKEQRKTLMESIEAELLQQYNAVSESVTGAAVVHLEGDVCQGCFTGIPPQLAIEVRKSEEVIACPHCNRMLYDKPEKLTVDKA